MNKTYNKSILVALLLSIAFTSYSQTITTIAGIGTQSYYGDGGQATAAEINKPYGVAVDASGNVYIADNANYRVRKVNTSGTISTFAGTGTLGYSGDGGQATAADIYPYDIAVDASGNIYIADGSNARIRKVNTSGVISTFAGGNPGYSGDGGQATVAELTNPLGVTVDALGNVYIADYSSNTVRKVNTSGVISTIAGTAVAGYNGDNIQATAAELDLPIRVAVDASGNVYISDGGNERIRIVNTSGIINTFAGNGYTPGAYSGDGGPATAAELHGDRGVALDASGNLYIVDEVNQRIRKVNTSGVISTYAGTGTNGYNGDNIAATAANLDFPQGVAVDASGNVYIADYDNARIRKVTSDILNVSANVTANINCSGTSTGSASATASNGASPYTYSWSPSGGTNSTASGLNGGTYTITVKDNASSSATASVTITQPAALSTTASVLSNTCNGASNGNALASPSNGTSPYTYSWYNGSSTVSTANPTGAVLSAGAYTVTVRDNCGASATASITITESTVLSTTASVITNVSCNGGNSGSASANPLGGTSPYTYSWSPGGGNNSTASNLTAGTYTVTATDNNGCNGTASVTITQPAALNVSASGPSVCTREPDTLTSTVSGGATPYTYSWTPSGGNASTAIVTPATNTTYTLTVTDFNGCSNSTGVTVKVAPVPAVSGTQTTCMGSPVILTASGGATYTWSNGATTGSITVNPPSSEVYTVTVANGSCTAKDSVKVIVKQAPSGAACCEASIKMGETTPLNVSPTAITNSYSWMPGAGLSCTNCPDPVASPTVTTTYYITITDSDGCTERDSLTITVSENCGTVFIPNVFSPNNDGQNDVLYVMGNCIASMDFIIYDRWGNKVFESMDQSTGWDGRYKGQPASIGTYVYYFSGTTINNQIVTKKGTVTLIR